MDVHFLDNYPQKLNTQRENKMTIVSNIVDVSVEEIIELVEEGEITMIDWMDGYQVHYIEEVNHKFGKYELQDECGGCFRHVDEKDILELYKDHSH